jgi:hypothetical protein
MANRSAIFKSWLSPTNSTSHIWCPCQPKTGSILTIRFFSKGPRCNYGGQRAWFKCPARGCGRRVAILYGGRVFACRFCYQLNYQVQHEQPRDRSYSRAQKLHARLGGTGNITHDLPARPKGMHRKTYEGLLERLLRAEDEIDRAMILRFGLVL